MIECGSNRLSNKLLLLLFCSLCPKIWSTYVHRNRSSIVLFRKLLTRERPQRKHFKYLNFCNVFDIEPLKCVSHITFVFILWWAKMPTNKLRRRTEQKIPIQIPYLFVVFEIHFKSIEIFSIRSFSAKIANFLLP